MTHGFNFAASHQAMVRTIFERREDYRWTVQGFGMLRTYLDGDKRWRLNIWDDRLAVPGVSIIHDHPWDFHSVVIAGALKNQRFIFNPVAQGQLPTHHFQFIVTGEDGGPAGISPKGADLTALNWELYLPGHAYQQAREEVHYTACNRGTITLNDRSAPTKAHTARVFWPLGEEWVDAKPRDATEREIERAIDAATVQLDMETYRAVA